MALPSSNPPMTQKERDDARCMARINRECKPLFRAAERRQKRFDSRWRRPMQHPKWRKAMHREIAAKVKTEWHMHGGSPEKAYLNLYAQIGWPV